MQQTLHHRAADLKRQLLAGEHSAAPALGGSVRPLVAGALRVMGAVAGSEVAAVVLRLAIPHAFAGGARSSSRSTRRRREGRRRWRSRKEEPHREGKGL